MELREYLRALRKRWWWVVAAVAVGLLMAGGLNLIIAPRYTSTITFFVTTPSRGVSDAYQGSLFSTQRVKSYAEVLTSDRLARSVVAGQKLGINAAQVRSRISARAVSDSVLLEANVTDTSPARSLRIARSLAPAFIALVQSLETPPGSDTPAVKVEVVAGPELNMTPVSPRPVRNFLLGGLLGLLVGVAAAVLRDVLDTSVRSPETLQRLEGGSYLASVGADRTARRAPLIGEGSGRSARAEELRHLRTNLSFVEVDKSVRVMTVTSAVAAEGKSTIAANLALVFAEAGNRVVLLDADLRKPRLAEIFDIEGAVGLTNVLAGQVPLDSVLQPWGAGRLFILPSGTCPPNPSELLGSRAMADLLGSLRDRFDMVIIDTPPLLPVTDAAVVAAHADGSILVVRYGRTSIGQVRSALQALQAVEARVFGYVLNMMPTKGSRRKDYYYYYGYRNGDKKRTTRKAAPVQPTEPVLSTLPGGTAASMEGDATVSGRHGSDRS